MYIIYYILYFIYIYIYICICMYIYIYMNDIRYIYIYGNASINFGNNIFPVLLFQKNEIILWFSVYHF